MIVILNIGLHDEHATCMNAIDVLQVVADHGFLIYGSQTFGSDTEPTLVLSANHPFDAIEPLAMRVFHLSEALRQDCIAYFVLSTNRGALAGPRSDAWGDFNPAHFITPDGLRLDKVLAIGENI